MILGKYDIKVLKGVFEDAGLTINVKKSATFNYRKRALSYRKTYCYLGVKIKANGSPFGATAIAKKMSKKAKGIAKLSAINRSYGFKLAESVIGGLYSFVKERVDLEKEYLRALKRATRLLKSLPQSELKEALQFIRAVGNDKEERTNLTLKLLAQYSTKLQNKERYKMKWNKKWIIQDIEKELKMTDCRRGTSKYNSKLNNTGT